MRPPPLLWLPLLLHLGAAALPAGPVQDAPSQLPAPQNLKIRLYNAEQVLSWEPVPLSNETGPVVYQVQHKYPRNKEWSDVHADNVGVNCSKITATQCDFSGKFLPHFNVSLRVRAELRGRVSAWAEAPWFQHYRNVTIGPPENIRVTPGEGSLVITLSPPFDITDPSTVKGPFTSNVIVLRDLKPLSIYCLQVQAQLDWKSADITRPGHLSNVSCHEIIADASTRLQQIALTALGTFLSLATLAGACVFLILKFRGLIKFWFHSPPGIPGQLEEYLKDPAQPILEALDQDSTPGEDAWDAVSVVSLPEQGRPLPNAL